MAITFDANQIRDAIVFFRREFANPVSLFEDIVTDFYIPENIETFATDGRGTWDPTQRPNPILRDTLALYNSFTDINDSNFVFIVDPSGFEVGSDVFYWEWHEFGWDEYDVRFPPRPITGLLDPDDPQIEDVIISWFDDLIVRAGI